MARTILLEQADHARAAWAAIEPRSQRSGTRARAGFEEPKPPAPHVNARISSDRQVLYIHVHVRPHREIAGVLIDPWRGLTDL